MADGFKITCTLDSRALARIQGTLSQKVIRSVVAKSLRRTGVGLRNEGAKLVKKKLGALKLGDVKSALITRNVPRASEPIHQQYFQLDAKAKGISLSKFKPKQTRRGVTVSIGGHRTLVSHGFMAKRAAHYESGAVWIRTKYMKGKGGTKSFRWGKKKAEFPINKLYSFSVHGALMKHQGELNRYGKKRYGHEFASNFSYEMKKRGL